MAIDEELPGEQPPEKRAKTEEEEPIAVSPSPPSTELADLKQKVIKLEGMYKRACRATRGAELRAERAENQLDSKREVHEGSHKDLDEELEKRLAEFTSQLAEARTKANDLTRANDALKIDLCKTKRTIDDLISENTAMKTELDAARTNANDLTCANDALKIDLFKSKRNEEKANGTIDALARENSAMRTELDQARRIVADADEVNSGLLRENAALKKDTEEAWRKVDFVRKEEARKRYLAQQLQQQQLQSAMSNGQSFDAGPWVVPLSPQPAVLQQPTSPFAGPAPSSPFAGPAPTSPFAGTASPQLAPRIRKLAEVAHPTNILEPCHPFAIDSITLDAALEQIEAKFYEYRMRGLPSVNKMLSDHFKKYICQSMNLICSLCGNRCEDQRILFHFKAHRHVDNLRANNAAVSEPALRQWLRIMQRAADAAAEEAAVAAAVVAAATAAAPPFDGAPM